MRELQLWNHKHNINIEQRMCGACVRVCGQQIQTHTVHSTASHRKTISAKQFVFCTLASNFKSNSFCFLTNSKCTVRIFFSSEIFFFAPTNELNARKNNTNNDDCVLVREISLQWWYRRGCYRAAVTVINAGCKRLRGDWDVWNDIRPVRSHELFKQLWQRVAIIVPLNTQLTDIPHTFIGKASIAALSIIYGKHRTLSRDVCA